MATIEMSATDIGEAINSITQQKDDLRKSFEILKSFSPSIVSITLQWKDIEDHLSPIEKSINERFREFKSVNCSFLVGENSAADLPVLSVEKKEDEEEVEPRPELKTLFVNMDGEGLMLFLTENMKDIALIRRELGPALLSAPDPVTVVLNLLGSSVESKTTSFEDLWSFNGPCLTVLECLKRLSVEIDPQSKGRAMEVAIKWKEMIRNTESRNMPMVLSFFHIVATFGLIELLEDEDVVDLIVQDGQKREFFDVWKNTALEEKVSQRTMVRTRSRDERATSPSPITDVDAGSKEVEVVGTSQEPPTAPTTDQMLRGLITFMSKKRGQPSGGFSTVRAAGKSPGQKPPFQQQQRKLEGNAQRKKCFRCGKIGHLKADCWQAPTGNMNLICNYCKKAGHRESDCRAKTAVCGKCKKVGHFAGSCPTGLDVVAGPS